MDPISFVLDIILAAIALFALIKAEVPVTPKRTITGTKARILGALLLAAIGLSLFQEFTLIAAALFLVILVTGLIFARKPN